MCIMFIELVKLTLKVVFFDSFLLLTFKIIIDLSVLEYVVVDLLQVKWKSFVKREFFTKMFLYTIFFCLASFCFISRTRPPEPCSEIYSNQTKPNTTELPALLSSLSANLTLNFNLDKNGSGIDPEPEPEDDLPWTVELETNLLSLDEVLHSFII